MFHSENMTFDRFKDKIWLSSPTMHGEELRFVTEAYETNWMSTVGENINEIEKQIARKAGRSFGVGVTTGTAAVHLAVRLAGERLYGQPCPGHGALDGKRVFVSDMTFCATINPILYEGGMPVFIDCEKETWNMDPTALEKAFLQYPDVRIVVLAHLYGVPSNMKAILSVADRYGALVIEDAAEALGAEVQGSPCGSFGFCSCISFNGNKIITGSAGGMFLTDCREDAEKIRKWSTQSREAAPWYQHEEIGYNYRISNVVAGVVRGQIPHLEEHIAQKKAIYERYRAGFADLPVSMNPYQHSESAPNFWMSCILLDRDAMCRQVRGDRDALYLPEAGKSCPTEILETLLSYNIEGRPIWKPMSMQPIYADCDAFSESGSCRAQTNAYRKGSFVHHGQDIFRRGLCLPSDNKMTPEQQDKVIAIVRNCFA